MDSPFLCRVNTSSFAHDYELWMNALRRSLSNSLNSDLQNISIIIVAFWIFQAQNRGATKFLSSPAQAPQNPDNHWNGAKTNTRTIDRRIGDDEDVPSNVQPDVERRMPTRRTRVRTRSTTAPLTSTTTTTTESAFNAVDASTSGDYQRNVPVVRVRGRYRNKNAENATNPSKTQHQHRPANMKSSNHAASSEPTVSSRPSTARNEEVATQNHFPANHRNVDEPQPNVHGRRIRVRVVQPNNVQTTHVNNTKNDMARSDHVQADVQAKPMQSEKIAEGSDELNYPEHFKVLLKTKKTPDSVAKPEDRRSDLFPSKKFLPKTVPSSSIASITTTTTTSDRPALSTTSRSQYKHKKIARPNKLLFPSLQTSLTTTTTATKPDSTSENDANQVSATSTEHAIPPRPETSSSPQTSRKPAITTKFSSKIRNMENLPSSGFKMRVIATSVNGSQEIIAKNDQPPEPSYQRLSAVSILVWTMLWDKSEWEYFTSFQQPSSDDGPRFSARYKNGESFKPQPAIRRTLGRDRPFYTPTTPPLTTQMVSVTEIVTCSTDALLYHIVQCAPFDIWEISKRQTLVKWIWFSFGSQVGSHDFKSRIRVVPAP